MDKDLPLALEPFRTSIQQATKPFVKLTRHLNEPIGMINSKLGGAPYLPYTSDYPMDDRGYPLLFIAQVNFAEVPPLEHYPTTGVLQFFLSSVNAQACTARYFPHPDSNPDECISEADLLLLMKMGHPNRPWEPPITRPGRLQFELGAAPPDVTDYHFEQCFANDRLLLTDDTLQRAYREYTDPARCHKLGGYGRFVQGDPRSSPWADPGFLEFEPILQLNSDSENFGCVWQDWQEICFFVRPKDLKQQDFSHIRYYLCP